MNHTGVKLPLSPNTFWSKACCFAFIKWRNRSFTLKLCSLRRASALDISLCLLQFDCSCSLHLRLVVFFFFFHAKELAGGQTDLITFLISFYISSHSSWSKLEQYRLVAISWLPTLTNVSIHHSNNKNLGKSLPGIMVNQTLAMTDASL